MASDKLNPSPPSDDGRTQGGPRLPETTRTISLHGPEGNLEAILEMPAGQPAGAAVICHPHPLHGGTMHNKVVYRAAKGAVAGGLAALRFNFRGVGASSGRHDGGHGEAGDVGAALDELGRRLPGLPLLVGGFSFGAAVGLRVAVRESRVAAMLGLGLPTGRVSFDFLLEDDRQPLLLIHGDQDPYGPAEDIQRITAGRRNTQLKMFAGQGHFFDDVLAEVTGSVAQFCRSRFSHAREQGREL